jgi:hypothetical protein
VPLTVDGVKITKPTGFTSWEGYRFTVNAQTFAGIGGKLYVFSSWSDGGAARHSITTPASTTLFVARSGEAQCGGGVGVGMLIVMAGAALGRWRRQGAFQRLITRVSRS